MTNLNLLFNKTYYKNLRKSGFPADLKKNNKTLCETVFNKANDYRPSEITSENGKHLNDKGKILGTLVLKTAAPGLLIGAGNPHGAKQCEDDINLGFSFDYVSGQPYIPGSSVKGVLRSKFRQYPEVIADILENNADINFVKKLESDIFDNKDVFLDAVVYDGEPNGRKLLGTDYITPHNASVTKNPVPVLFIKVLPRVQFEFRFKLSDSEIDGVKISAGKKKHLFEELLMLFGAGAKTNVGYGGFEKISN